MRILVSAGPTREFLDTVRFLSNASSGKQGYAIAAAAAARGHGVILVSGPVALDPPVGARVLRVTRAAEMAACCHTEFGACDAAVMTAAVCDYRPAAPLPHKLKKSARPLRIVLEPTADICASLGRVKENRILVGFAMEDRDPQRNAERKLRAKNCDLMVLNGAGNIGADRAEVQILSREGGWVPHSGTKHDVAHHLLDLIEARIGARGAER